MLVDSTTQGHNPSKDTTTSWFTEESKKHIIEKIYDIVPHYLYHDITNSKLRIDTYYENWNITASEKDFVEVLKNLRQFGMFAAFRLINQKLDLESENIISYTRWLHFPNVNYHVGLFCINYSPFSVTRLVVKEKFSTHGAVASVSISTQMI